MRKKKYLDERLDAVRSYILDTEIDIDEIEDEPEEYFDDAEEIYGDEDSEDEEESEE